MARVPQETEFLADDAFRTAPANRQEQTHDELVESLGETLKEAIDLNKHDAIIPAGTGFKREIIAA
ncbi:MAG: hypothetical protein JXD23_03505 [Spirochaetales bacterium]|nr:hypothetical protein [Spirochaetales bacterium]